MWHLSSPLSSNTAAVERHLRFRINGMTEVRSYAAGEYFETWSIFDNEGREGGRHKRRDEVKRVVLVNQEIVWHQEFDFVWEFLMVLEVRLPMERKSLQ